MGIEKMLAIEVDHCPSSYGCFLTVTDYGNIIYSGDTRVCINLENYAQNAKILIHEATHPEDWTQPFEGFLSNYYKHTSAREAIEIG